jgi:hypothetical protein
MAEVHWKVLGSTCEGVIGQIVASFQDQVINHTVRLNYGPEGRPTLTLKFEPIADPTRALVIELVKAIIDAPAPSALVTHGVIDLAKMLENAGLPVGDDVQAKLDAIREALKVAPPPVPQSFGLAKQAPSVPSWDEIAAKADADAKTVMDEIRAALSDPLSIDRRRLQRGSDGIPPPTLSGAGGGEDRGGNDPVPAEAISLQA